ncbi:uncharacterized protein M421DRAFT_64606, partial [Didymella exigua CBS 183.55]
FLARNPRVASIVGRKIKSARTTAANYNTINDIPYKNVWSFDETGVALGVCTN